ncbi:MAG: hypothetical protein ACLTCI_02505 [[Clostridium] nexile]
MGRNLKVYIGKSFYSEDKYFRGYFDNIKVYIPMTDEEVKKSRKKKRSRKKDGEVKLVAEKFGPNADNIKGNITLPSEKDGVLIQWSSSNPKVINPEKDGKPAGVVTRRKKIQR